MPYLIIEPQNVPREEVEDLAQAIRDLESGIEIRFSTAREQFGYGVTWREVVNVWLPYAAGVVSPMWVQKLLDLAVEWARNRFKQKGGNRPKCVTIYGPDGKPVRSVLLKDQVAEPEDRPGTPRKPLSVDE